MHSPDLRPCRLVAHDGSGTAESASSSADNDVDRLPRSAQAWPSASAWIARLATAAAAAAHVGRRIVVVGGVGLNGPVIPSVIELPRAEARPVIVNTPPSYVSGPIHNPS